MAVFQQQHPTENAIAAAESALGLLSATDRLNRESNQQPIEVHIGISSGVTLVGSTRFHGRRGNRWVFSASGRQVNVAAQLAGIARPGQILISSATKDRLSGRYFIESAGTQKLKNIAEEIEAFQLVRLNLDKRSYLI